MKILNVLCTLALVVAAGAVPRQAQAAALGFTGTGNFVIAGNIGNLTGGVCFPICDSGNVAFTTGALLGDGLVVSGFVRQTITENAQNQTTSALLRVTGITATNTGPLTVNDNLFIVSDLFDLSLPGTAGVGLIGAYVSNAGPGGDISFASTQAQMNYLTAGFINNAGFGGPLNGFSLTTPSTFVTCVFCSPVGFWESAFINNAPGGVQQLVGAINFTLGPGSSAVLPGSLILEDNNDAAINSELPEPVSALTLGSGLLLIAGWLRRRK